MLYCSHRLEHNDIVSNVNGIRYTRLEGYDVHDDVSRGTAVHEPFLVQPVKGGGIRRGIAK